jgi:hypothetical protein
MSDTEEDTAPTRVGRLDTARDIRREAARLYRACRRGDVDPADGSKMASILALIVRSLETQELEERVERLEGKS